MSDRIQKVVVLKAPRERVWRAVSDAQQFGAWFGVEFAGPFVAGARVLGKIVPTRADPEVAKLQEPHRGLPFEFVVERIDPMDAIVFRWHPFAIDKEVDYAKEPMTTIEMTLEDAPGGTRLTITESGFDRLPPERRAAAFRANDGGWTHQAELIRKYLDA